MKTDAERIGALHADARRHNAATAFLHLFGRQIRDLRKAKREESNFMKKSLKARVLSVVLLAATLAGSTLPVFAAEGDPAASVPDTGGTQTGTDGEDDSGRKTAEEILALIDTDSYMAYSQKYASKPRADSSIVIEGASYDPENTTAAVEVLGDYEGKSGVLQTPSSGKVTWKFTVPKSAKYAISVEYYNTKDTNTTIERISTVSRRSRRHGISICREHGNMIIHMTRTETAPLTMT